MFASFSRALKIGLILMSQSALLGVTGCSNVPDVVVRVFGIPQETTGLKASLWQLRSGSEARIEGLAGSPIPAFSYQAPTVDPNQPADNPEQNAFRFGLRIPEAEGVLYSVDVAAFQTFGNNHCLLTATQQAQADNAELQRGAINLPQEFTLLFPMEDPKLLSPANIDGLCLTNLDEDTHPIVSGIQLSLDQSRRLGANTTAVITVIGWNFRPRAKLLTTRDSGMGQPPTELNFPLQIASPSRITLTGIPAEIALGLTGQPVGFVVENEDKQRSIPYVTQVTTF
jgi:hypothetical protein